MHIFTNISEVHFGPRSTADFRCFKYCSLFIYWKSYWEYFTKYCIFIKKEYLFQLYLVFFSSILSVCSHSSTFEVFIHMWDPVLLIASEPQATGGQFLLQLRLACLASIPPPESFSVSLFVPSGKLFLHFSHPLRMILVLLPAAHTESIYIHKQSPGKQSFWPVMHACVLATSPIVPATVFH